MTDCVTPNTVVFKHRTPMASKLQSPTTPFLLGSNDDQLERAQARAARAAASRRKSIAPPPKKNSYDTDDIFGKDQIRELFQNCIKLASENKINQKNTWDLSLIDHLSEIINVESEDDNETNFQKASCTLEAGVKIYSLRVDSVHSEAYKVLGGINRAGREVDQDGANSEGDVINDGQEEGATSKKETEKKISHLSTLESSFDALNVKKFDVAFTVDPLYHHTSAQFDEGGAKGLLLNNLGVYHGCRVLFDSLEKPGKSSFSVSPNDTSERIDLSFIKEHIKEMVFHVNQKNDISPTLREIVTKLDDNDRKSSNSLPVSQETVDQDDSDIIDPVEVEDISFNDSGNWDFNYDNQGNIPDDCSTCVDPKSASNNMEKTNSPYHEFDEDSRDEEIADYLFLGLGFTSKANAWAGPDHWKYRKAKGLEQAPTSTSDSFETSKPTRRRKTTVSDIDFIKSLEKETPDIFASPKNPKSLLLPANRASVNTKLPEDRHYQPEDLVKLFLLPDVLCLEKKQNKVSDETIREHDMYESLTSWDVGSNDGGDFDDHEVDHSSPLISQPRKVNKIEVQYDKTSKQVDVHALKEAFWHHTQECASSEMGEKTEISFRQALDTFPDTCPAIAKDEISPHLCFICLLHLANEHGLRIVDCSTLDDLIIHITLPSKSNA